MAVSLYSGHKSEFIKTALNQAGTLEPTTQHRHPGARRAISSLFPYPILLWMQPERTLLVQSRTASLPSLMRSGPSPLLLLSVSHTHLCAPAVVSEPHPGICSHRHFQEPGHPVLRAARIGASQCLRTPLGAGVPPLGWPSWLGRGRAPCQVSLASNHPCPPGS